MPAEKKNQAIKGNKLVVENKNKPAPRLVQPPVKPKATTPVLKFPHPISSPVTSKKWCFVNTPILASESSTPLHTLNPGNVVTVKQQKVRVPGSDAFWSEVEFIYYEPPPKGQTDWIIKSVSGWVDEFYLDTYTDPYPDEIVTIENATPNPTDARQYMSWPKGSEVRHNMCGELCVTYIIRKEGISPDSSLEQVLDKWSKGPKTGAYYNESTIKEGTTDSNLRNILELYPEYQNSLNTKTILSFTEGLVNNGRLDWDCLKDRIKTHYFIAQVMIEKSHGALIPNSIDGIRHWIVVEDVTHDGTRVKLYNPFPNKQQEYSLTEFLASCRINLGLFVKRKNPLSVEPAVPSSIPQLEVALDTPQPAYPGPNQGVQYINREEGKKTNLCGQFSVAYILGKSIDNTLLHWKSQPPSQIRDLMTILRAYGCIRGRESDPRSFTIGAVLDYWRDVQPDLYKHHVVSNHTTAPRELITILNAYGYTKNDILGFQRGLNEANQPLPAPGSPSAVVRNVLPSPERIANTLQTYFLVAGVGIDGHTGKLKTRGEVRHWVVVERIEPVGKHYQTNRFGGNGGWVELYNPFMDVMEHYSYLEFVNSMNESGFSESSGFWVKRVAQPVFTVQDRLLPTFEETGKTGGRQPQRNKPVERWKSVKLIEMIQRKIEKEAGKNVSPDTIASQLLGSGWSREEIIREVIRLMPASTNKGVVDQGAEFEKSLLEKLRKELKDPKTQPPALTPDVIALLRDLSGGEVDTAGQLLGALSEMDFVTQGAKGEYSLKSSPTAPATNIQANMDSGSGTAIDDRGTAVKVANVIRPLLAARARAAMTKIQTAPKPPVIIDVIGEKPVIQKTTAPVPKYRVMWDWEMDNFKGISERRANEPCVFRLGELTDNKNGHYSKLTREWQFFWFDLCSRICFGGRTHEKLTKQEYKWLADKWTSMTATTTAFTNQKGTDRCSNFITNERLGKNDELPMIYTLICGGASLAGDPVFDAGNGRWMLKVARFDGNRPPPPVETIDPYTDPRVFFATTIDPSLVKNNYEITPFDSKSGARASAKPVAEGYRVNPFPQFDKARFLNREGLFDCPVPIVATRDVYYPMKDLVAIDNGVKPSPYFPQYAEEWKAAKGL